MRQEGLNGRKIGHNQGKLLGGSSAINAQAIIPPSISDLQAWEDIGNPGWGRNLSKELKKSFTLDLPDDETVHHLHAKWASNSMKDFQGPVKASFSDSKENPISKAWVEAFETLGHTLSADPFCGVSTGPYNAPSSIDHSTKTRSHASIAYYAPVSKRTNLTVFLEATVEKIILQDAITGSGDPRACGVLFNQDGQHRTLKATKEVILSAGVFNSPKLLELSGIGDPAVLRAHDIEVKVANHYVGTNLQDHILTGISFEVRDGVFTGDALMRREPEVLKWATDLYQSSKTGPFCTSGLTTFSYLPTVDYVSDKDAKAEALAFLDTLALNHPLDGPRIARLRTLLERGDEATTQYSVFPAQSSEAGIDTTNGLHFELQPGNFITLVAALSHPLSTGTTHIRSNKHDDPPKIDHKYLNNNLDLELHARHVRYLETIAEAPPVASLLKPNGKRNDAKAFLGGDLDRAEEFVKAASTTNWHSCGTCAMAPKDKGGVVDHELKVYGVEGLRVIDASIFPIIPQSNLQTLVYAIAERASDIIRRII